jgi:hypothetical protein
MGHFYFIMQQNALFPGPHLLVSRLCPPISRKDIPHPSVDENEDYRGYVWKKTRNILKLPGFQPEREANPILSHVISIFYF